MFKLLKKIQKLTKFIIKLINVGLRGVQVEKPMEWDLNNIFLILKYILFEFYISK